MNLLDYAKSYLDMGWSLMPIVPETKEPPVKWTEFQTRRAILTEVEEWIAKEWYLAVVTGDISGVLVVDDDRVKHGLNEWGFSSPVVAKSQSGGKHYYFNYDREIHSHSNSTLRIDLKAWHSYCLLPPFNGREWLSSPSENLINLTPIPDEIVRLINSDKVDREQHREPLRMADFIDISEGARNDSLHRLSCSIFNHMSKDEGTRILSGVNQTYNPPLGQSEFDYQVSRAWQFVQDHPKSRPEIVVPDRDRLVIKSGIPPLDNLFQGFHSGGGYIIGGEEKCGKTSLVLNLVQHFTESGYKVFYASTELKNYDIQNYMDSISGKKDWTNPNFHFYDLGETGSLKEHIEIIESELVLGTQIVVIDNLTSYRDHNDLHKDEWMRISTAGDAYRKLGRKWEALVFMVLHLNQGTKLNEIPKSVKDLIKNYEAEKIFDESVSVYGRPSKDNLKGGSGFRSQTFGQILIWRPYQGFYSINLNKLCCLIVENNRYGPTGEIRLNFNGATKKFEEVGLTPTEKVDDGPYQSEFSNMEQI